MSISDNEGGVMDLDPTVLSVVVAVFVVVVSILVFILKRCFASKADTILFAGLNGAGKTVVFSRLINEDNEVNTYVSMTSTEYSGYLTDNGESLRLVDFPGAERLRKQLFEKMLHAQRNTLKGIVLVVDSSTFSKESRDVAELLYDILYESGKSVPILIACNKQDLAVSKSSQAVSGSLEREIGLINQSREAALQTTEGDVRRVLTDSGKDFCWDELPKARVEFVECTAQSEEKDEDPQLSLVVEWIDRL
ncbi:hypothetical protein L596_027581 [Steinernema carpocapsae]|uniref:Signal recognition particle receptor subunit beta n=1 Tax=Steinernema carpocapsae TaxID=34508 RepID=A0A4U5LVV4_STECR|nr:hypothetical protein L596_027581 [Steinernema carpocapsae]